MADEVRARPPAVVGSLHGEFLRRCQYGIQTASAFLAGAFLAYGTSLSTSLSVPYLIPVMAAMLLQTSIGMSLLAAAGLVISLTPICIFFYLLQKGLGYHDFAAIAILLFFSTWFIAYRNPTIAQRKMPLIIVVIFWTSICNTPNGLLPPTFAFQLLEAMVIGLAVALAASLVVFPTSACYELHQRLIYCLHGVEQASELIITAFVCHCQPGSADTGCERCQVRRLRAMADLDIVIALLRDTRAAIRSLIVSCKGEFVPLVQKLTGLPLTPAQEVDVVTQLVLFLAAAQAQLKAAEHRELEQQLHKPALSWHAQFKALLDCIRAGQSGPELEERFRVLHHAGEALLRVRGEAGVKKESVGTMSAPLADSSVDPSKAGKAEESGPQVAAQCLLFSMRQLVDTLRLYYHRASTEALPSFDVTAAQRAAKLSADLALPARLLSLFWPLDIPILISSLRSALIIGVGSVFVLVPSLAAQFEQGTWILIAMCMTQGNTQGGAFLTMRNRLFGTMLGSVFGYLCYLAVGTNQYHFFGLMVPWILLCTFARYNASWSYAATIATITPLIIVLGNTVGSSTPEDFAILRIQENVLGILLGAVLNMLLLPINASDTLSVTVSKAMQEAEMTALDLIAQCSLILAPQPQPEEKETVVRVEVKSLGGGKRSEEEDEDTSLYPLLRFVGLTEAQLPLIDEAAAEPRILIGRFPLAQFRHALAEQQRMAGCLFLIQRLLTRVEWARKEHPTAAARLQEDDCRRFMMEVSAALSVCLETFAFWRMRVQASVRRRWSIDPDAWKEQDPRLATVDDTRRSADVMLALVTAGERLRMAYIDVMRRCAVAMGKGDNSVLQELKWVEWMTVLGRIAGRLLEVGQSLSIHLRQAVDVGDGRSGKAGEELEVLLPY